MKINLKKNTKMKKPAEKNVEKRSQAPSNLNGNHDARPDYSTRPDRETVIRTVSLILVLINQVIVLCGRQALPFTEDQMYAGVSAAATVVVSLWTWWKNNSFTAAARSGDRVKNDMKRSVR